MKGSACIFRDDKFPDFNYILLFESFPEKAVIRSNKIASLGFYGDGFSFRTYTGIDYAAEYRSIWKVAVVILEDPGCLDNILRLNIMTKVNNCCVGINIVYYALHYTNVFTHAEIC